MPVCSTSTSALMLLPLLILLHQTSSHPITATIGQPQLHELHVELKFLKEHVEKCPENCSLVNSTDTKCKCLNINTSQGICPENGIPMNSTYFIRGLEVLSAQITAGKINNMKKRLINFNKDNCWKRCSCLPKDDYKPIISPKSFHKALEWMKLKCQEKCFSGTTPASRR